MQEKVSIIIPIYKVEEFLKECVDSVLEQTYHNLEIILVDDGSPDNCPEMCDNFKRIDDRIKVIHKKNGGLSDARNAGLRIATGDYFFFLDSDDWIEKNTIEFLLKLIKSYSAQIAITTINLANTNEIYCKSGKDMMLDILKNFKWEAWGKLYHKSVVEGLEYPKGELYEDLACTPQIIYHAHSVVYSDSGLYHYRIREDSIMGMDTVSIRKDLVKQVDKNLAFFKEHDNTRYPKVLHIMICFLKNKRYSAMHNSETKKRNSDFLNTSRTLFKYYFNDIMHNNYFSIRQKLGIARDIYLK